RTRASTRRRTAVCTHRPAAVCMMEPAVKPTEPAIVGTAKIGRKTKALVTTLTPDDIAVIDHTDLDRVAAETLVAAKPRAVVNASASMTGRYPNVGPLVVTDAGIPLIDAAGPSVMEITNGTV